MKDQLDAAIDVSWLLFEAAAHRLTVSLPPEPLAIDGDQMRLTQIVGNLPINAAKYTPPGGRIELSVNRKGEEVEIIATDSGYGPRT